METSSQDSDGLYRHLFSLQNILAKTTENLADSERAIGDLLVYIVRILKADAGFIFERKTGNKTWELGVNTFLVDYEGGQEKLIQQAKEKLPSLEEGPKSGIFQVEEIEGATKFFIVPITYKGTLTKFLCLLVDVFRSDEAVRMLIDVELTTGFFLYGNLVKEKSEEKWGFERSSGLLEVLKKTIETSDYSLGIQVLTNELQKYLKCSMAVLASYNAGKCTVESISETANFDKRGNIVTGIKHALEEALEEEKLLEYPAPQKIYKDSSAMKEHQQLYLLIQAKKIISIALKNPKGEVIGGLSFIWKEGMEYRDEMLSVIMAAVGYIGSAFEVITKIRPSFISEVTSSVNKKLKTIEKVLICAGLAITSVLMFVPFQYKITAPVTLEPVLRRHVEAPFKSVLKKAYVEPGDIVEEGALLAELEEKDLISELAELSAARDQALKQAATELADKDPAKARISQLEAEKNNAKIALLNDRRNKLKIKSPIAGMIVQGELKRLEGSPLEVGEALLEIAPLNEMYVEIELPEGEIRHISLGLPIYLKLDAFPQDSWTSTIKTIMPTATIKNNKNVFILEAKLTNFPQQLRPGMAGNAKIKTEKHPLYWILFHKAWDFIETSLFW